MNNQEKRRRLVRSQFPQQHLLVALLNSRLIQKLLQKEKEEEDKEKL